jgi:Uma2 family endonuclease
MSYRADMLTPAVRTVDVPFERGEQRVLLRNVAWRDYIIVREAIESPSVKMTYCEGVLEIMSPSRGHEHDTKMIARLVELYAFLRRIPLNGYRSTTFRSEAAERGCEPDESYTVGRTLSNNQFPDIVIEVVHTNPLLDKLEVYRAFGVSEVWTFEDGSFVVHALVDGIYQQIERSRFLPDLDLELVARLAAYDDQQQALEELRARA